MSASGETTDVAKWPVNKVIRPMGSPAAFFRRLRITMRGVVIEDIMDYNRVSEMFEILTSSAVRRNTMTEGFGMNYVNDTASTEVLLDYGGIVTRQTVCFKPLSGILMQTKVSPTTLLPLRNRDRVGKHGRSHSQ